MLVIDLLASRLCGFPISVGYVWSHSTIISCLERIPEELHWLEMLPSQVRSRSHLHPSQAPSPKLFLVLDQPGMRLAA